ncbi:protein RoBo-1-like [Ranitomeya imitator]|uniref:protein RoBo-1-like n=1 Tax=Ranitomeya imitator TaxID=111125 RepID=UPI001AA97A2A
MKNLVTFLCMISALVGSVFSYKCNSCMCPNSTKCEVSETECLGDRCMIVSQYFCFGDKLFKSFYKGCANETLCGTKGTGSVEMMKFRFHVYCCTGDLCNNQEYEIFEEDPTPNGVKCPSCFRLGTLEECKTNKEMNCTGSMNRCVEYRAKIRNVDKTEEDYSFKGCINSDSCRYNFDSYVGMEEIQRVFLKC